MFNGKKACVFFLKMLIFELRPSHTAAKTKTITITTQGERFLLVELLHPEYAHAHIQPIEGALFASWS